MSSNRSVRIEARFHGSPNSGNGGYVCGLVAAEHGGPCDVRLRLPPPLDKPLQVLRRDDGVTLLRDGDAIVAEARDAAVAIDIPAAPSLYDARKASKNFTGFKTHVFPTCFVCGPQRESGDGLRIFPGALRDDNVVLAPWTPHLSLANEDGMVADEFLWAALDCPGAFTNEYSDDGRATVLGSLSCAIVHRPRADEEYIVIGWPMGGEGRKAYAGTAIFDADGTLYAYGKATWIWIDVPA